MEIHAEHISLDSDHAVTITAFFTPEEQQILTAANLWQTTALDLVADRGFWREGFRARIRYYELVTPGYRIQGFANSACAERFIGKIRQLYESQLRSKLGELIRAFLLSQRDAFFNGGTIDIPALPAPTPMPPAPRGLPPILNMSLDGVPTKNFSRINLADFVEDKIAPPPPANVPEVEHITWHFEEPEHDEDHTIRLYAVLSAEERALVKRFGLHHHSFGEVPIFDDEAIERLMHAQEQELAATSEAPIRASLRIEHQEQLKYAREAKMDITLETFLAYPFVREYPNRWKATAGQKNMQATMMKIKALLDEHRDK